MRLVTSSILLLAITGCFTAEPPSEVELETFEQLKRRSAQKYSHVAAEIRSFLTQLPNCSENPVIGSDWCDFVEVGLRPSQAVESSKGQRILIIDNAMQKAAFTRYRSRLLDALEIDANGYYKRSTRTFLLYNAKRYILDNILNERFPETPAISLKGLVTEVSLPFPASVYAPGHGDRIFATLADLNPHAQFVIAGEFRRFPLENLSQIDNEEEFLRVLGIYLVNASSSLIAYIQKYEINYVNMSFGDTVDSFSHCFDGKIKANLSNLHFYRRLVKLAKECFYDRIFSLQDVVFVQAAVWTNHTIEKEDPDFLADCVDYPNRIRVGSIEMLKTDLPKEGGRRDAYVADQGARKCADVYVNSGVEVSEANGMEPILGDYPYLSTFDGIGVAHLEEYFSSSWAAPLLMSYLIYRKNDAASRGEDFSIDSLRNSQRIFEPVKYKQLEMFRLGVL